MDEQSVRQQLAETKDRLKRVDEERDILLSLIHGFEGWLRFNARPSSGPPAPAKQPSNQRNEQVGAVSMRFAIRTALQEAHGAPLHTTEILKRALEMGAKTTSDRPESVVDLTIHTLKKTSPIEKVRPRTWRWAGNGTAPA